MIELLLGGKKKADKLYVDDVFSTHLYTGNGGTQMIDNGIDLAGKGGLVWAKARGLVNGQNGLHCLFDSERGPRNFLQTNATSGSAPNGDLTGFDESGFSLGYLVGWANLLGSEVVSWTFRRAKNFFDTRTVAHIRHDRAHEQPGRRRARNAQFSGPN